MHITPPQHTQTHKPTQFRCEVQGVQDKAKHIIPQEANEQHFPGISLINEAAETI